MQTSAPGLFATSMMATQDFGPFFAFTVSARTSARLIGAAVGADRSRQATAPPLSLDLRRSDAGSCLQDN